MNRGRTIETSPLVAPHTAGCPDRARVLVVDDETAMREVLSSATTWGTRMTGCPS